MAFAPAQLKTLLGKLPPREQRGLIVANMLGAKLIGRTMEVPAERLKCSTVWM
jgi:hypothetical protein